MSKLLYKEYLSIKELEKQIKEKKQELEIAIYNAHLEKFNSKDEGTISLEDNGYKVKVVKKETVTVDQNMAEVVGLAFTKKYSLDKKAYKSLSLEDQRRVDECLTTKPSKPSFSVERID